LASRRREPVAGIVPLNATPIAGCERPNRLSTGEN